MTGLPPPDYDLNGDGERVIAASKRPDGTVRKERRVRAGYVPQDEKAVYVSRGTAVSSRLRGAACCRRRRRRCTLTGCLGAAAQRQQAAQCPTRNHLL